MFNQDYSLFPYVNEFYIVCWVMIFVSIGLITYMIILEKKLQIWINENSLLTDKDKEVYDLDQRDLLIAVKGIKNTVYSLWLSQILTIIFFIMR
jgi:hypothetical protein